MEWVSWIEIISLLAAALAAGAINAIAGGGTLVTFPVLILFGIPPVIANATSTLALVIGVFGGFFGFRRLIAEIRPWLPAFLPISLLGGWIGSFLLTHGKSETFSRLVPYLILFATILFMLQGVVRKLVARRAAHGLIAGRDDPPVVGPGLLMAVFFQFLVSVYGGYFGAGIGILMLATFGILGFSNIHRMNALKNLIGGLINVVAAVWFTVSGLIDWPRMAVMAVGALAGYYLGATYSQKMPQAVVRNLITAIGLIITVVMFWKLR
jgi:uncharacterized membrane protein YfcA